MGDQKQTAPKDHSRGLYLGRTLGWDSKPETVHVQYRVKGGNLAITGVIGAKRNGDASGSAGQCQDEIRTARFVDYAAGWSAELVSKFLDVWDQWHLNDLRAGCVHRGKGSAADEMLEVPVHTLTTEAYTMKKEAEERVLAAAAAGEPMPDLNASERFLLGESWFHGYQPEEVLAMGLHRVEKTKTQRAGNTWPVIPTGGGSHLSEHPRGLLGVPCPECGHRYGSDWQREEIPPEVFSFLAALPYAEVLCPWASMR